nr:type II secretion system protein [uncultured Pantoea sp.]
MNTRCRGFTLLEMIMVMLLLAAISQWVMMRLPSTPAEHPLDRLLHSARWAAEQAQTERRIYQIHLEPQRWQTFALIPGDDGEKGPLPDTVWQPVYGSYTRGLVSEGILQLLSSPRTLPIMLWFMPDGDMTQASLAYIGNNGDRRQLQLSPATLFAVEHE